MFEITELLTSYVRGIRVLSGAERATLFVPAPLSGLSQPLLIEAGAGPRVPELETLEMAVEFASATPIDADRLEATGPESTPLVVASCDAHVSLLPLPSIRSFWSSGLWPRELFGVEVVAGGRRRTDARELPTDELPAAWLGLRLPADAGPLTERLQDPGLSRQFFGQDPSRWWTWLFSIGGALAGHVAQIAAVLTDPVTGLPDRTGFQAILSETLEKARLDGEQFTLLLVNPDDFTTVNERFGRPQGDSIVREIADRLRDLLRASDPISRYGGVVFAVILRASDTGVSSGLTRKVLDELTRRPYLDGAVRLGFSLGFAVFEPQRDAEIPPVELLRRADQALNAAKRSGGGCAFEWRREAGLEKTEGWDRLSGIFTGNTAKDYRNMVLLWDTIDAVASCKNYDGLAGEVVDRVYRDLRPARLGLFLFDEEGELILKNGITRAATARSKQQVVQTIELDETERKLLGAALADSTARVEELGNDVVAHVVPLQTAGEALGALFLAGPRDQLVLDASDRIFLRALAGQVAVALDRARLAERDSRRRENERRDLRAQLHQLRDAIHRAKLVYQSTEMGAVLSQARRVAPTDATVLITGESGTGKELVARTVHELSPRRKKPLAIVDCVAIATTLMESELFGHEKGAYTGAQGRRVGRLAEADGGTVLLDEIGELPLEVQSKLLRFVQEKQYTPVGGSRPKRVDVRILAATNRDLEAEARAGRFREDLFYRLNVVSLEVPPLRARPDDILHLARYFLETYSLQYQKPVRRFSEAAQEAMLAYPWPGNVRELQNRIMQAVILSEGEELGAAELDLAAQSTSEVAPRRESQSAEPPPVPEAGPATSADDGASAWSELRRLLAAEIDLALSDGESVVFPFGLWLREDLVLEAHAAGDGVTRRGAEILGVPETTFRRRQIKANEQIRAGLSPRSARWDEVRTVLRRLVREERPRPGSDLVKDASRLLLEEILERLPSDTAGGSRLLGVTAPTYRTRVAELEGERERNA